MRIALQTVTGSTYTSDDQPVSENVDADEVIEHILLNFSVVKMEIHGRKKFFPTRSIVWMQAVS